LLGLSVISAELVAPKALSEIDAEWAEAEYADGPAFIEADAHAAEGTDAEAEEEGISHTVHGRHGMVTYISPGRHVHSGIAYSAPASVEVVNTHSGTFGGPIVDTTRTRLVQAGAVIPPAAAVHPVVNAIQGIDHFDYAVPVSKYFRPHIVGEVEHVHGHHHHHHHHGHGHAHGHFHGHHHHVHGHHHHHAHVHSHPVVDGYEYHYGGDALAPVRVPASASWLWHGNGPVTAMSGQMEGATYASYIPTGATAFGSAPVALFSDGTPYRASMHRFGGHRKA